MEIFNYVNSKETESLAKTAADKSAWIKACIYVICHFLVNLHVYGSPFYPATAQLIDLGQLGGMVV